MIINLGTIDILQGLDIMCMKYQFDMLLDACRERNIIPIITTLAPLASDDVKREQVQKLGLFNHFLITRFKKEYCVIDLHSKMVNIKKRKWPSLYRP